MRDGRPEESSARAEAKDHLVRALVAALATDPEALDQLRALLEIESSSDSDAGRPAYTADALGRAIGVTAKAIRNAIARGELAAVKRGGRWLVSAEAVAAWTRAEQRAPAGPLGTALARLDDGDSRRRIAGP